MTVKVRLVSKLSLCVLSAFCSAAPSSWAESLSGKGELIFRSDFEQNNRYEANFFGGEYKKTDSDKPLNFHGGLGFTDADAGDGLQYIGGVTRLQGLNDSTLLFNYSDDSRKDMDIQVKTKLFTNTYISGGVNEVRQSDKDTWFTSLFHDVPLPDWYDDDARLTLRAGFIEFEDVDSLEGTIALTSRLGSVGINANEEEIRAVMGYRDTNGLGAEVTYADQDQGRAGPRAVLANFTLISNHPFLSNPAREGRLLGRSGTSAANPILAGSTFLNPYVYNNFNRLQFLQDIGDGLSARFRYFEFPNELSSSFLDIIGFPAGLTESGGTDFAKKLFVGLAYDWSEKAGSNNSDLFGFEAGIKGISLGGTFQAHFSYRGVGMFQDDESETHDFIAYLTAKV